MLQMLTVVALGLLLQREDGQKLWGGNDSGKFKAPSADFSKFQTLLKLRTKVPHCLLDALPEDSRACPQPVLAIRFPCSCAAAGFLSSASPSLQCSYCTPRDQLGTLCGRACRINPKS